MDIAAVTFANGQSLTKSSLETPFASITGHQITHQDLAVDFSWGVDLNLDSHGILNARHFNGQVADARYWLDGDDSDAIQAAIDWLSATSAAKGIVFLAPISTGWSIDKTVNVPSGISIIGTPDTILHLDFNGYAFTVASNGSAVKFEDFQLHGNQRIGGLVTTVGASSEIAIRRVVMGDPAATTTEYANGYVLFCAGAGNRNIIEDCQVYGGGGIYKNLTSSNRDRIVGNRLLDPSQNGMTSAIRVFDVTNCDDMEIADNYCKVWHTSGSGCEEVLHLNLCDRCRIHDNEFWGSTLGQVTVTDSNDNLFQSNKFMNGGTAGTGRNVMELSGNSDRNVIDGNTISCSTLVSEPALANYSLSVAAGCDDSVITNNVLEMILNATGPTGPLRCVLAGINLNGVPCFRSGNTYFRNQIGEASIPNAAPTASVTVTGIGARTSTRGQQYHTVITLRYNTSGDQTVYLYNILDNAIEVARNGAGNIPANQFLHWHVEG